MLAHLPDWLRFTLTYIRVAKLLQARAFVIVA
jgi:hypothetical protein